MTPGERWLATLGPLVRARFPAPPLRSFVPPGLQQLSVATATFPGCTRSAITRAASDEEGAADDEHATLRDREVAQSRLLGSGAHRAEIGALQAGATLARNPYMQRIGDEALSVRREAGQAHAPGAQRKPGGARHGRQNRCRTPRTVGKQRGHSVERAGDRPRREFQGPRQLAAAGADLEAARTSPVAPVLSTAKIATKDARQPLALFVSAEVLLRASLLRDPPRSRASSAGPASRISASAFRVGRGSIQTCRGGYLDPTVVPFGMCACKPRPRRFD